MPQVTAENFWDAFSLLESQWFMFGGLIAPDSDWYTDEGPCVVYSPSLQPSPLYKPSLILRCTVTRSGHHALRLYDTTSYRSVAIGPQELNLPGLAKLISLNGSPDTLVLHPSIKSPPAHGHLFGQPRFNWFGARSWSPSPAQITLIENTFKTSKCPTPEALSIPHATPLFLKFLERKVVVR